VLNHRKAGFLRSKACGIHDRPAIGVTTTLSNF
jgi:hypothetical protein